MTQRDMAGYLDITPQTLRNWRKHKPHLYKIVMLGFRFEELLETVKNECEQIENMINEVEIREELKGYKRKD